MNGTQKRLRVLHFPQIGAVKDAFKVEVANEKEAYLLSEVLANQHLWLEKNNIIPDYSNIILVEQFEDGEWCDYMNDEGEEWNDYVALHFENESTDEDEAKTGDRRSSQKVRLYPEGDEDSILTEQQAIYTEEGNYLTLVHNRESLTMTVSAWGKLKELVKSVL